MIDAGAVRELIETYKKHGWILRRVLLSDALSLALETDKRSLFGDVPILGSDLDAAWFSRPPKPGGVAWEIRYLGDIPYALLENVDEENPEFESKLTEVEGRLRASLGAKRTA
jgi:hypothetical protein